jgi:hypothetical protein
MAYKSIEFSLRPELSHQAGQPIYHAAGYGRVLRVSLLLEKDSGSLNLEICGMICHCIRPLRAEPGLYSCLGPKRSGSACQKRGGETPRENHLAERLGHAGITYQPQDTTRDGDEIYRTR